MSTTSTPGRQAAFADLLRRYRRAAGLTQEELAERAGLSARAITALERGVNRAPHRTTLELLSDALQLSAEDSEAFYTAARRRGGDSATLDVSESDSPERLSESEPADNVPPLDMLPDYGDAGQELGLPVGGFLGALPERPLVTREDEMRHIAAAVEAVQTGQGRMLFLAGEPGVGKTRLAQEASVIARAQGFLIVSGRCHEPYQTMPYHPFVEALTAAYASASPEIRDELPRSWPDVARLLPGAVHDRASAVFARGPEEQQRLFWSVTRFVQALATWRPIALLLDDLQWADEASLGLLQHLAQHTRASRVLLLGTYRDTDVPRRHPLRRMVHDLSREHLVERVAVARLPEAGTAALVASAVGAGEIPTELAGLIHRHTDGNPFFTVEVLHALMQRGDVVLRDGRWERPAEDEIVVPETVQSAIDERLARLDVATQELLQAASVLGESFIFDDLMGIQSRDEAEVERCLEEAISAVLLQEIGPDRYAFNHILTQQALLKALPLRRKRRLHLAAGAVIEQLPASQRAPRVGELAWHFMQAEERARALPYVFQAGDLAQAIYAHAEAEGRYRTALQLARELGDAAQEAAALTRLGAALLSRTHWDEAVAVLEQAANLFTEAGDNEGLAEAMANMCRCYAHHGRPLEGIERVQPLLDKLEANKPTRALAVLYAALGHLYLVGGRYDDLLQAAERAVQLAATTDDTRLLAESKGRLGTGLMLLDRIEEGRVELEETVRLATTVGDLETQLFALNNLADSALRTGPLELALAHFERAMEVALRLDFPMLTLMIVTNRAQAAFLLGRWQEARVDLERTDRMVHEIGESAVSADPLILLGRLYLAQGRIQDAVRTITEGLASLSDMPDMQIIRDAQVALAERDLLAGRCSEARDRLLPLLDRPGMEEVDTSKVTPLLAWAYFELGESERAEEILVSAIERMRSHNLRVFLADALRIQGMLALRQERWEVADHALQEAIATAEEVQYPYAQARALHLAGALSSKRGERATAEESLRAALAIFERLGARADADRTLQTLNTLG